jgi:hypothetical protein
MKTVYYLLAVLLLFWGSTTTFAQYTTLVRKELNINEKRGQDYKIINLGKDGFLAFLENEEILNNGKKEFVFQHYDSLLNNRWSRYISVDIGASLSMYYYDGQALYVLIAKGEREYEVYAISPQNGLVRWIPYNKLVDMEITHFTAANGILYFGGSVDSRPVVIMFDYMHQSKPKVLPDINRHKAQVNRIEADAASRTVCIVMTSAQYAKKSTFYYHRYDFEGNLLSNSIIEPDKEYMLFTFRPYLVSRREQYMFGTYSVSVREKAQGLYVAHFQDGELGDIRFYDFGNLKNFFNYLNDRKKEKIISKIKDQKEEGKTLRLDYNLFVRELRRTPDDRLVLVAESYFPVYSESMQRMSNSFQYMMNDAYYGNRMLNNGSLLGDPRWQRSNTRTPLTYRYKHALVCAFDLKGKLLWDNSFEFKDLDAATPEVFMEVSVKNDSLSMFHLQENKMYAKRTYRAVPAAKMHEVEMAKENTSDKIADRSNEDVLYWYDEYFLLFGEQELKSKANDNSPRRKVFYLEKIKFSPPPAEEKKEEESRESKQK